MLVQSSKKTEKNIFKVVINYFLENLQKRKKLSWKIDVRNDLNITSKVLVQKLTTFGFKATVTKSEK